MYALALGFYNKGDIKKTLSLLDFHLKNTGVSADAYEKIGDYLVKLKLPNLARLVYNEALVNNPKEVLIDKLRKL